MAGDAFGFKNVAPGKTQEEIETSLAQESAEDDAAMAQRVESEPQQVPAEQQPAPTEQQPPAEQQQQASPVQQPPPPEQQQQPAPTEQQPVEGQEAVPTEQQPPARKYANRFDTPEDLERSYLSMQQMESRTKQQYLEQSSRVQQLEQGIQQQIMPLLQELEQRRQDEAMRHQGEATRVPENLDTMDPQAIAAFINQQVEARMAQERNQGYGQLGPTGYWQPGPAVAPQPGQQYDPYMAGQGYPQQPNFAQQAADRAAQDQAIATFRRNHPQADPAQGGQVYDEEMARIVDGYGLDPRDPMQLEIAWSIWENPGVGSLLKANPQWLANPEGRGLLLQNAERMAPGANGNGVPIGPGVPARQNPQAHVEQGGSGAPVQAAPGGRPSKVDPITGKPADEVSDVFDLAATLGSGRDAFGFPARQGK